MSIQHVKAFYEKLSQDEIFRDQVKNAKSKEECSRITKDAGYHFTRQELEDYTSQLLENDISNDTSLEIGERELEAVHGGFMSWQSLGVDYGIPPLS